MQLKALLVVAALAAVMVGLLLPTPNSAPKAKAVSQMTTLALGD